jgi:lysyl-tRNA synthetase class 2
MENDNEQIQVRKKKLELLQKSFPDQHAYPNQLTRSHFSSDLHTLFEDKTHEELQTLHFVSSLAGRIKAIRDFGKAGFLEIQDEKGDFQIYCKPSELTTTEQIFYQNLDIGDIIAVTGFVFKTKTKTLSLHCNKITLLSKSLRPFPEKFHGLTDIELKYRQRYLDLIVDSQSRKTFILRSQIVDHLREFFKKHQFMEVETPMLHPIAGGAAARPFTTHHNTLDLSLNLRIAPELYLKRLIVGGFERVFEINRNFRNEGISTRHNPEFTMIEFYQAYATYENLMDLFEELFCSIAERLFQKSHFESQGQNFDFSQKWARLKVEDAVKNLSSYSGETRDAKALMHHIQEKKHPFTPGMKTGELLMVIFDEEVSPQILQPTFVTHYPLDVSPLSRKNDQDPFLVDRFEVFIGGREIANAFSELNDPADQRIRFEEQAQAKAKGNLEACELDEDFLTALEYGMPPCAGAGIGVDRLTMLFANTHSIRDVILFPLMKPLH